MLVCGQSLPWASAFTVSVDDVEDAHHAVVFMEQQMAVIDAASDEIDEVCAEAYVGVPWHVYRVGLATRVDELPVAHLVGYRVPRALLNDHEVVDMNMKRMLFVFWAAR